jgi:DNA-binding transcriptional ArsR family regulator
MKNTSNKVLMVKKGLTELCYGFFSTLANPTRLAIVEKLLEQPMNVTTIAESLQQEQSMISHNLRQLVKCKFVKVERIGKQRIYSVNNETVETIIEAVENHAEKYCLRGDACSMIQHLEA